MPGGLEAPTDSDDLYLARGDEVAEERPVFTGDVFVVRSLSESAERQGLGPGAPEAVIVLQHPCALRTNGVDLVHRLLVAEVVPAPLLAPAQWQGSFKVMPLPALAPQSGDGLGHRAGQFNSILVMSPSDLTHYDRMATLSAVGVNLLLQRWVHHNSRVIVPTHLFAEVTVGPFEEADLMEEWVGSRFLQGADVGDALAECHAFLRERPVEGGLSRQESLGDRQRASEVRRAARRYLHGPFPPSDAP